MATALLPTFPNTFREQPLPAPLEPAAPASWRRAQAFINTHLDADIGLDESAAAARISPRDLPAAFRRHLDTTPTGYFRTARLDAAHLALLTADPAITLHR